MRDYVILTDSCCDLSAEMAAELGVEVLPLSLQMGDRTYRNYLDGREIGFHEFYERVRSGDRGAGTRKVYYEKAGKPEESV